MHSVQGVTNTLWQRSIERAGSLFHVEFANPWFTTWFQCLTWIFWLQEQLEKSASSGLNVRGSYFIWLDMLSHDSFNFPLTDLWFRVKQSGSKFSSGNAEFIKETTKQRIKRSSFNLKAIEISGNLIISYKQGQISFRAIFGKVEQNLFSFKCLVPKRVSSFLELLKFLPPIPHSISTLGKIGVTGSPTLCHFSSSSLFDSARSEPITTNNLSANKWKPLNPIWANLAVLSEHAFCGTNFQRRYLDDIWDSKTQRWGRNVSKKKSTSSDRQNKERGKERIGAFHFPTLILKPPSTTNNPV